MPNNRDRASLLDISRAAQKILQYKLGIGLENDESDRLLTPTKASGNLAITRSK